MMENTPLPQQSRKKTCSVTSGHENMYAYRSALNDEILGAMLDVTLYVVGGKKASTPVSSYRGGKKSSYHIFRVVTVE
jgi:hypothetical protein